MATMRIRLDGRVTSAAGAAARASKLHSGPRPLLPALLQPCCSVCAQLCPPYPIHADGVRWPELEAHLGARYRQFALPGRPRPDPALLLRPGDRTLLSSAHMVQQLLG